MELMVNDPLEALVSVAPRARPGALRRLGRAVGLAAGDAPPFDAVVLQHQGMVRAFLRRLCDADALADDLAQETFLKARRALPKFRGEGSLASWLLRIAYREFLGHRRRRSSADVLVHDFEDTGDLRGRGPDRTLERDVRRALQALSPDERAAIAACFFDELTHEEAAFALDMPLGTLKSHVARGKEKLRGALAAYAPKAEDSHER